MSVKNGRNGIRCKTKGRATRRSMIFLITGQINLPCLHLLLLNHPVSPIFIIAVTLAAMRLPELGILVPIPHEPACTRIIDLRVHTLYLSNIRVPFLYHERIILAHGREVNRTPIRQGADRLLRPRVGLALVEDGAEPILRVIPLLLVQLADSYCEASSLNAGLRVSLLLPVRTSPPSPSPRTSYWLEPRCIRESIVTFMVPLW